MGWYKRPKREFTDVQMDAFLTDHGLNPHTYLLASMGHKGSQEAIERYFAAKARTEERRRSRKPKN